MCNRIACNYSRAEKFTDLSGFLEALPGDLSFAVEFRHQSWYTAESAALLSAHGMGWAATEYAELPKKVDITTDFLYIRFIGQHGRFLRHDREQIERRWWGCP